MRTLGEDFEQLRTTTVDMYLVFLSRFPSLSNKVDKEDSMLGNSRVKI